MDRETLAFYERTAAQVAAGHRASTMLHKKHGVPVVNGRRIVHTAAFRAEERKFADYQEAESVLKELAQRS
jgi:hypothetical protein